MVDKTSTEELRKEPAFAVICSFFNKFGSVLGLKPQSFSRLETILTFDDEGRVEKDLIDLHVKLLRKAGAKGVAHSRWENSLAKYCALDPDLRVESFTLERFGYAHSPLGTKLNILKCLCERQFDWNPKFKEQVTSCTSSELRLLPVGVDSVGKAYWYQLDSDLNLRIYSEEPDDSSGATWVLQATGRDDLRTLIDMLNSGETEKAIGDPKEDGDKAKEDDTSPAKNDEENETEGKQSAPDKDDIKNEAAEQDTVNGSPKQDSPTELETKEEPDKEKTPEEEEAESKEDETPKMCIKNKKGTFMDTYQSIEDSINKKGKETQKKVKKGRVSKIRDEIENETDGSTTPADKSGEESQDIPEELRPFIERGIQPRRSARNAAKAVPSKIEASKESSGEEEKEDNDKSASSGGEDDSSGTEDSDYRPLSLLRAGSSKRRRRKKEELSEEESEDEEENVRKERKQATDNSFCKSCAKSCDWEVLLLCDKCDDAWHTYCLKPSLWYVPDDDWFCPKCQHAMLIEKLTTALTSLDEQLKKKALEDKRKERQQERLKREMAFIGVSLNNIIKHDTDDNKGNESTVEDEEDDNGDDDDEEEERRPKKKSKKPIVPIALSRTKRETKRVDYTFSGYDELVQEALEDIADSSSKPKYTDPARPTGGLGRGKDMANILQAEAGRDSSREKEDEGKTGKPPLANPVQNKVKKKSKLTDMDIDEMTESDTDEYQVASESEFEPEEDEPESEDEYLPESRRGTRRSARINGPTQSDEDFVRSGSSLSESDYRKSKRKSKSKARPAKKKKRKPSYDDSDSGDSIVEKAKRKRWGSDTESSSEEEYRPSKAKKKTKSSSSKTGRSARSRKVNYRALVAGSDSEEEENSEDEPVKETRNGARSSASKRPTGAYRGKRKGKESPEEEYNPESEDEEEEAPEDNGSNSSEDEGSKAIKGNKRSKAKKSRIESSSDEEVVKSPEPEENDDDPPEEASNDSNDKTSEVKKESSAEREEDSTPEREEPSDSTADDYKPNQITSIMKSETNPDPKPVSVIQQQTAPALNQGFQPVIPRGNSGIGTPPHSMSPFRPTGAVGTPPPQIQLLQPRVPSPVPLRSQTFYGSGGTMVGNRILAPEPSSSPFASLQPVKPFYPVPVTAYPSGVHIPTTQPWVPGTGAPGIVPTPGMVMHPVAQSGAFSGPQPPPTVAGSGGAESLSDVLSSAMQDEF